MWIRKKTNTNEKSPPCCNKYMILSWHINFSLGFFLSLRQKSCYWCCHHLLNLIFMKSFVSVHPDESFNILLLYSSRLLSPISSSLSLLKKRLRVLQRWATSVAYNHVSCTFPSTASTVWVLLAWKIRFLINKNKGKSRVLWSDLYCYFLFEFKYWELSFWIYKRKSKLLWFNPSRELSTTLCFFLPTSDHHNWISFWLFGLCRIRFKNTDVISGDYPFTFWFESWGLYIWFFSSSVYQWKSFFSSAVSQLILEGHGGKETWSLLDRRIMLCKWNTAGIICKLFSVV